MATVLSSVQMDDKVTSYISKNRKMLINGQWVEAASGKTFPTYNPATGEVLARVAEGDREDIDRAVKAARAAFETGPWSKMTPSERGRLIWKLGDLLEQNLEEFAELEMLDNGKPLKVARVADVPLAVDLFRYMSGQPSLGLSAFSTATCTGKESIACRMTSGSRMQEVI